MKTPRARKRKGGEAFDGASSFDKNSPQIATVSALDAYGASQSQARLDEAKARTLEAISPAGERDAARLRAWIRFRDDEALKRLIPAILASRPETTE